MVEINFNYENVNTTIQCNHEDKIKDIINIFLKKNGIKENNLFFYYDEKEINNEMKELTFNELAYDKDKKNKKLNIIVLKNELDKIEKKEDETKEIISKDIICPDCKEIALIEINNFQINIKNCKNNHQRNNISLNEYEQTQKIDFDNIINYENKNYICEKHNESFINYCDICKKDICYRCKNISCKEHKIIEFDFFKKEELEKTMEDLKDTIDKFKFKIDIIKDIFDRMINTFDLYYKINKGIIDNYNESKRNYYKLQNLSYLKNNNKEIIKYINDINNNDSIFEIYKFPNDKFHKEYFDKGLLGIYFGEKKNYSKEGKGIFYFNKPKNFDFFENKHIDTNIINEDSIELYIFAKCYNKKKYEGDFKNDKIDGKGILYYNNGNKYEGNWKNDKKEGKGILYYNNGNKYEGNWKNDKKEGKGIFNFNNGDRYEGDFKDDKREGKGILNYNNGNKYEGNWKNDKKEGNGIFNFNNGDRYDGDFKDNKIEGKGIVIFNNGDRYDGYFKNFKKEGKGVFYLNNGCRYEGDWKNDIPEGKGVIYLDSGDRYEGDFKDDKLEGKGILYYNNGDRYEGDVKKFSKEGKGIFYFNNGDRYKGDFKDDKREGKGILYYNNGDRYEGNWKNDEKEGKGIYYSKNGTKNEDNFKNAENDKNK